MYRYPLNPRDLLLTQLQTRLWRTPDCHSSEKYDMMFGYRETFGLPPAWKTTETLYVYADICSRVNESFLR